MGILDRFHQKSLSELEEETEHLGAVDKNEGMKLSIAQKRQAVVELKKRGLEPKHFGKPSSSFTWSKIIQWLKTH